MKKSVQVINKHTGGGGNAVYAFGLIGALVYFIQQANSLTEGVIGILKAIVWPAFVAFNLLEFFKI